MILGIVFLHYRISKRILRKGPRVWYTNKINLQFVRLGARTQFNGLPVELWAFLVRAQRGMTAFIRVLLENRFTDTQRLQKKWV
jgi:hypothetical protein